ncbi:flavin reductase family protein [Planctomonas sp. JC2975]|uniref:flavin reductase family protein n=1 Tax=Planctomonas sp. JC2975 TaxID=2729626 RepID=UPI001473DE63|nr:flavin reductase family protein [Planctomonas sp. JC2975]NNC13730.1 flavin reductase family protein [Planctomonas sp. JC2975]
MSTQQLLPDHYVIDPAILYFGTPVALLSTIDSAGEPNLAPMSSVFWFGKTAVLGMGGGSQTSANLLATGECVINLPSEEMVDAVDRLALTTGRRVVSDRKRQAGYRYLQDKWGWAGLTAVAGETVNAPRVAECAVQLEGKVHALSTMAKDDPAERPTYLFQVRIDRVHVAPQIRSRSGVNRIDADRWRPLIMSFQQFYGLGRRLHPSRLATIDEEWYR